MIDIDRNSRSATVKTDKSDYAPGTTVTITGGGWQPGEWVTLMMVESPFFDTHPLLSGGSVRHDQVENRPAARRRILLDVVDLVEPTLGEKHFLHRLGPPVSDQLVGPSDDGTASRRDEAPSRGDCQAAAAVALRRTCQSNSKHYG